MPGGLFGGLGVLLAALAVLAQLAVIDLSNAAQNAGSTWRDGTAVHGPSSCFDPPD